MHSPVTGNLGHQGPPHSRRTTRRKISGLKSNCLSKWVGWARRCRIPAFVKLQKSIAKHRSAILASTEQPSLFILRSAQLRSCLVMFSSDGNDYQQGSDAFDARR